MQAAITIINALKQNPPLDNKEPLTPEETVAVEAANKNLNEAVNRWDLAIGK